MLSQGANGSLMAYLLLCGTFLSFGSCKIIAMHQNAFRRHSLPSVRLAFSAHTGGMPQPHYVTPFTSALRSSKISSFTITPHDTLSRLELPHSRLSLRAQPDIKLLQCCKDQMRNHLRPVLELRLASFRSTKMKRYPLLATKFSEEHTGSESGIGNQRQGERSQGTERWRQATWTKGTRFVAVIRANVQPKAILSLR